MDYFCYIARSKVDGLYQGLSERVVEEWVEKRTTENEVAIDAKADWNVARVINLFKAGITYGRKGVIQHEQKLKLHYVQKLKVVLLSISAERSIPSLAAALERPPLRGLYFHVDAAFTLATPVVGRPLSTQVISMTAVVGGRRLTLDCSLGNFSDGNQPEGYFEPSSSNSRFFGGSAMPLRFEAVIVVLSLLADEVVATPLFLKLSDASNIQM